jgi:hypothetical protein
MLYLLENLLLQKYSPADRWTFPWSTNPSTKTENYLYTLPFLYIHFIHLKRHKEGKYDVPHLRCFSNMLQSASSEKYLQLTTRNTRLYPTLMD